MTIETMETDMLEFFQQGRLNSRAWTSFPGGTAYVRVTGHVLPVHEGVEMDSFGRPVCLDIANITVDEEKRGQGVFTGLLQEIESLAQERHYIVRIESILNPGLRKFLQERGYVQDENWGEVPTYYLPPKVA